jgi:hypothetical protein
MTRPETATDQRPLVFHVLYRFATGDLENSVVNLLNRRPASRFRHAALAIDTIVPASSARLKCSSDTSFLELNTAPGHALQLYGRIWQMLRELKPSIHLRPNLAAFETQLLAAATGVSVRIHSEHGCDVEQPHGTDKKRQLICRLCFGRSGPFAGGARPGLPGPCV